jgi:hypothetical protein
MALGYEWCCNGLCNIGYTICMMNKEIILEVKNVYGNELIYPSCHIANALIKLKDKKTFNKSDLDVFKSLGMNITWKARTV